MIPEDGINSQGSGKPGDDGGHFFDMAESGMDEIAGQGHQIAAELFPPIDRTDDMRSSDPSTKMEIGQMENSEPLKPRIQIRDANINEIRLKPKRLDETTVAEPGPATS